MVKTFRHSGLQRFFETGSKAGIQAAHASKLARQLRQLNDSAGPEDMDIPGWNLHELKGRVLKGHWSVWVNKNWRLTFTFDGQDAILVDYQDYH
ncbi:MAG: type II toxin-antitoxin system RelE/ParE family toxin [Burkholderiaceae bacterium]